MRALSARELVELWERGLGQHPVDRALTVLAASAPEQRAALAGLSIGCRDARLLAVYEHLFGTTIDAFAECPQCAEPLEYSLPTQRMHVHDEAREESELTLAAGELSLRLRLPNSLDLSAAAQCSDPAAARSLLLERCVLEASQGKASVPVQSLSDAIVELVAGRLAEADPQAELLIHLTCSACRHDWQVLLEIESFLWAKIHALARRLLTEVHILARAYGWHESEILALSALRRQAYLTMIGS
jgi:hypothetical protein